MNATPQPQSFRMPGSPSPAAVNTLVSTGAPTRKLGLVPMQPDSGHMIQIGSQRVQVTCRDRRGFPRAGGKHICLHPGCQGRAWATERELREAHPSHVEMVNRGEVHLHGFWSDDDCNPPVAGCTDCEKATREASRAATAAAAATAPPVKGDKKNGDAPAERVEVLVARACDAHGGGAIGLLTPTDPNG